MVQTSQQCLWMVGQEVVRSVEEAASQQAGVLDLLKKENLAPFVISLWLMLGQQLSGMNAVMFFAVSIFEAAGTKMNSVVENIIVAVAQVVSTLAAALLMDKLGRRLLLLLSSLLMVISIGLLGLYFYIKDDLQKAELAHQLGSLPVISLSVFVSAFSIGFGPIPWLMMSELFSPEVQTSNVALLFQDCNNVCAKVKAPASSLSTTFNWSLAFLVTKFFSNLVSGLGEAWAFWAFGLFTIITFFFCLLFVPETKVLWSMFVGRFTLLSRGEHWTRCSRCSGPAGRTSTAWARCPCCWAGAGRPWRRTGSALQTGRS